MAWGDPGKSTHDRNGPKKGLRPLGGAPSAEGGWRDSHEAAAGPGAEGRRRLGLGRAAPDASLPEPLSLKSQLRGRETPVPEFILCSLPARVCTLVFLASWRCRPGACGGGWGTVGCDVGLRCL